MKFLKWYFATAPGRILLAGRNFLIFGWHFFSIGYFFPRLFSPWHRDVSGYGRGFDPKRMLHVLGWNLISRVIGAIMRLVVLVAGLVFEVAVAFGTAFSFIFWYVLPATSVILVLLGIGGIIE